MLNVENYKGYIIAAVILVVCLAVYFNWDKIKQKLGFAPKINGQSTATPTSYNTGTPSQQYTNNTVLKKGMRGSKVKELQLLMNATLKAAQARGDRTATPLEPLVVDGIFGNQTAMRLFALTGGRHLEISINAYKKLDA